MKIYKELKFKGDKAALDAFSSEIYNFFPDDWVKPKKNRLLKEYIIADYIGDLAPHAEVSIYYGSEIWREGVINVGNIIPLEKGQLTKEEYNKILDLFKLNIIIPYCEKYKNIEVIGSTTDNFDPLSVITENALSKLILFCNTANKSTGSSHPCDENRWFDFVCQTVDDDKTFDYNTLLEFLKDSDYWNKYKTSDNVWSEARATELASEYDNYVRILKYYKETRVGK